MMPQSKKHRPVLSPTNSRHESEELNSTLNNVPTGLFRSGFFVIAADGRIADDMSFSAN